MPIPIADIQNNESGAAVRAKLNEVIGYTNTGPLRVYRALLSQSGNTAPTAIVLSNSVGAIVWTRTNAGIYAGTLNGAFPSGKVLILVGAGIADSPYLLHYYLARSSNDTLLFRTVNIDVVAGTMVLSDDMTTNLSVEIAVYP